MTVPAAHGLGMRRVLLTISVPDSAYTSTSGCSCHGPSCHTPNHRSPPMRPRNAATASRTTIARLVGIGVPSKNFTLRSEEHTSELQSLMRISYAVFCLKKKKHKKPNTQHNH